MVNPAPARMGTAMGVVLIVAATVIAAVAIRALDSYEPWSWILIALALGLFVGAVVARMRDRKAAPPRPGRG